MDKGKDIHEIILNVDLMGLKDEFRGGKQGGRKNSFQIFYLRNKVYCSGIY